MSNAPSLAAVLAMAEKKGVDLSGGGVGFITEEVAMFTTVKWLAEQRVGVRRTNEVGRVWISCKPLGDLAYLDPATTFEQAVLLAAARELEGK